jgi:hypothetical protein
MVAKKRKNLDWRPVVRMDGRKVARPALAM